MKTLRSILYGSDNQRNESWGYISESGAEIRIGDRYQAERICSDKQVVCVQLSIPSCADMVVGAVPQLGEGTTFTSYLSSPEQFKTAVLSCISSRR